MPGVVLSAGNTVVKTDEVCTFTELQETDYKR